MSTSIFAELVEIQGGRYSRLSVVKRAPRTIEDLADYVQRVRAEKKLSQRTVEAQSNREISKGYIGQIENRDVLGHSVTPQKLRALARGLQVPEDDVFAIARGLPVVYDDPLDLRGLFDGWDEATEEERAQAIDDVRMIAERFQRRRRQRTKR